MVKTHIGHSLTAVTPKTVQGRTADVAPETWDAIYWAQMFHATYLLSSSTYGLDEATRGIKHMLNHNEDPIWVTVAIQMLADIRLVMEEKGTLEKPFKEYQDRVRKASSDFGKLDPIQRLFTENPKMTQIGPLYQNMRNTLKGRRESALNDRWSQILEKNKLTDHDVLGKTVKNKNWSKFWALSASDEGSKQLMELSHEETSNTLWPSEVRA